MTCSPLDGDTAVVPAAAEDHVVGQLVLVAPVGPSGCRVDRDDSTGRFGDVHHAVDDERRCLGPVERPELVDPLNLEVGGVPTVNLVEAAVALALVVAGIHEPVLRFRLGVEQAFRCYRGERGDGCLVRLRLRAWCGCTGYQDQGCDQKAPLGHHLFFPLVRRGFAPNPTRAPAGAHCRAPGRVRSLYTGTLSACAHFFIAGYGRMIGYLAVYDKAWVHRSRSVRA